MTYTMQNNLQIEFRGYTNARMNGSERIVSLCLLSKRKKFQIFEHNFASIAAAPVAAVSAVIAI